MYVTLFLPVTKMIEWLFGTTDIRVKPWGEVFVIVVFFSHVQYEVRARLDNLSGNSSISSADLFDEQKKSSGDFK